MNFLISENQLKLLAEEVNFSKMSVSLRKMNNFTKKLVDKVEKKYKLNLKLLLTWGPGIGGLVLPLDNFLKTGSFELNETQHYLILAAVASTLFLDNKEVIKSLISKVKEEGLYETYKIVSEKAKTLKYSFVAFIESLNTSLGNISDILSYAFLVPIVGDLQSYFSRSQDLSSTAMMVSERMIASGVVLVSAAILTELIKKIIKRIS